MAVTQQELTALYLAYFGRPPDFDGLQFYLNNPAATIQSVAANFSASPESQAMYGTTFGAAAVNAIYQNLFGRDAEPAGIAYWTAEVAAGRLTPAFAAYGILIGAQNADKTSVQNKLAISTAFVAELDTAAEIIGYSGADAAAAAREFLRTVNSSADSLTAAQAALKDKVAEIVEEGGSGEPVGETIILTDAIEDSIGTGKADTFKAVIDGTDTVFNVGDSIDGKDGTDTLEVLVSDSESTQAAFDMTSVEKVLVRAVNTGVAFDATNWEGVEEFGIFRNAGYAAAYNLQNGVTLSMSEIGTLTTSAAVQAIYAAGVVDEDFVQKVVVDGVATDGEGYGYIAAAGEDGTAVTAWDIEVKGDSSIAIATNGSVEDLTVSGAGSLIIGEMGASGYSFSGLKTFDASANTGGVEIYIDADGDLALESFVGSSGDDRVEIDGAVTTGATIALGAGNDVLVAAEGNLNAVGSVDGGEGTDAISLDALVVANAGKFKNFEIADLAGAEGTIDLALFTQNTFSSLRLTDYLGGDVTLQNLAGTAINLDVESYSEGTITALLKTSTGTADTATITYDEESSGYYVTGFTSTGLETVSIVSNGDLEDYEGNWNGLNTLTVTGNTLTTVNISGAFNFELDNVVTNTTAPTTATTSALTLIDGSTATGDLDITAGGVVGLLNYKGLTIKTGSGDDYVYNLAASGKTELGAGEDYAQVTAVTQTVSLGTDEDADYVEVEQSAGSTAATFSSAAVLTINQYGEDDVIDLTAFSTAEVDDYTTEAGTFNSLTEVVNAILADTEGSTLTAFEFADGATYVVAESGVAGTDEYVVVKVTGGVAVEDLVLAPVAP